MESNNNNDKDNINKLYFIGEHVGGCGSAFIAKRNVMGDIENYLKNKNVDCSVSLALNKSISEFNIYAFFNQEEENKVLVSTSDCNSECYHEYLQYSFKKSKEEFLEALHKRLIEYKLITE